MRNRIEKEVIGVTIEPAKSWLGEYGIQGEYRVNTRWIQGEYKVNTE